MLSPKTFCLQSSLITTLEQCQVAATSLGLPFGYSWNDASWNELGGCVFYDDKVYFNSALHAGNINTGYRAICIKGEGIEHICTYYDPN